MKKLHLQSTRAEGLRFDITKFLDKATARVELTGATGVPFERTISNDELTKFGYVIKEGHVFSQETENA